MVLKIAPIINIAPLMATYKGKEIIGRPTRNLVSMCLLMVYQLFNGLTDKATREALERNLFLQTALGMEPHSDETIIAVRSLWGFRDRFVKYDLFAPVFGEVLDDFIARYNPNCTIVRGDGTHANSNMKKMGRIELCFSVIRGFLRRFSRSGSYLWKRVPEGLQQRYGILKKSVNVFSMAEKKDRKLFMEAMVDDLSFLVHYFVGNWSITGMDEWQKVERVFNDQCALVKDEWVKIWGVKTPKARLLPGSEVLATAPRNPSDGEATYSRHKGAGYTWHILENVPPPTIGGEARGIALILSCGIKPANEHESGFFPEALEDLISLNVEPKYYVADASFGSSENDALAEENKIKLISPVNGNTPRGGASDIPPPKMSLTRFGFDDNLAIHTCPRGRKAMTTVQDTENGQKFRAEFKRGVCSACPKNGDCLVKIVKSSAVLTYTKEEMRLAIRRKEQYEALFIELYCLRSGVEASVQKLEKMLCPTGRVRYRGLAKMKFVLEIGVIAENLRRIILYESRVARAMAKATKARK
jgi:hypothetical protein